VIKIRARNTTSPCWRSRLQPARTRIATEANASGQTTGPRRIIITGGGGTALAPFLAAADRGRGAAIATTRTRDLIMSALLEVRVHIWERRAGNSCFAAA